ncbi:MAG TPA: hypothetical protein VHA76_01405 [Solirubrobacterales bacterium]|nr:hypothetical protein [Solirubrobacterales bacterium]
MKKPVSISGVGVVLALAVLTLAVLAAPLPGAAAASLPVGCSNKTLKLTTEETPPRHFSEPVKAVKASAGVTCAQAYEIIRGALTGKLPNGWKLYGGTFTPPSGFVAELARKGSRQVQFAVHGG